MSIPLSRQLLLALLLAGCSDQAPDSTPTVSPAGSTEFARLGFAVAFQRGCGDCHDQSTGFGGLAFADLSPDAMRAAMVDVPSRTVPSMKLVAPGDPDGSFMVRKLRGDLASIDCAQVSCGNPMPLGNYPFAEGDRIDFEQWVLDGAR